MKTCLALLFCFCFIFVSQSVFAYGDYSVKSPDGNINFVITDKGETVMFRVLYRNTDILRPSSIRYSVNNLLLTEHAKISEAGRYTINEQYPVLGVHSIAHNHCNGSRILIHSPKGSITIDIRVYNDGIAFRQHISLGNAEAVPSENTVFNIPKRSSAWYHDLYMHYEGIHVKKQVDSISIGEWLAPPLTYKTPMGVYASITEADLVNYPGMALQANGKGGFVLTLAHEQPTSYPYRLRYSAEDTLRLRQPAKFRNQIISPWRVIIIGKDLNTLVNNDIVSNLNPAPNKKLFPKGIHTEWIKPGRAVWKYLNGGGEGTVEVMKHFADQAAALGFEHNILEGFWSRWSDEQIRDLVNYSKAKGVQTWVWKHSKSLRSEASRDSFFKKCSELGIAGAKIDFFDHEAMEVINLYETILKEAAKYHLMLDFHGANKPTGLSRTYPNELTVEAVKGMEASKLSDRATHETTIPFTRLLAGPAEYTVMHFGERRKNTTWAHQVASAAILSAPLLTYAANPDTILMNPAVQIIKDIPSTWDETIVLPPSEIGQIAVYARRKADTWFLAVMNGVVPIKVTVPLSFLKGSYNALIASDEPGNPASIRVGKASYHSNDSVVLDLTAGGGYIAEFKK